MHTPDPTRLPTMGPWIPITGDETFENGDRILLAMPIVGGTSHAKYLPHTAPWRYDFHAVTIRCDEHFFDLEGFDGESCGWGLEDADYYLPLGPELDRPSLPGREPDRSESGGIGDHILPSLHELATALRELHDFAAVDTHHRYESRSRAAFEKAHQLLDKFGY